MGASLQGFMRPSPLGQAAIPQGQQPRAQDPAGPVQQGGSGDSPEQQIWPLCTDVSAKPW